jgi:hypothetical protein
MTLPTYGKLDATSDDWQVVVPAREGHEMYGHIRITGLTNDFLVSMDGGSTSPYYIQTGEILEDDFLERGDAVCAKSAIPGHAATKVIIHIGTMR